MKIKTLFLLNALISVFFGLNLLLFPAQFYRIYEQTIALDHSNTARLWGAAILGYGFLTWSVRNVQDSPLRRLLVRALFFYFSVGFLTALFIQLATPQPLLAWSTPAIYFLLAAGYGYFHIFIPVKAAD